MARAAAHPAPRLSAHLRFLGGQGHDLLWYSDADGCVREVLGPAELLFGLRREEFLADPHIWRRVVHADDQGAVLPRLEQPADHLEGGDFVVRVVHADGRATRRLAVHLEADRDRSGQLRGVAGVARPESGLSSGGNEPRRVTPEETEDGLRALFEYAGEAIFLLDPESLFILEHNRQAEALMQTASGALREMSFDWLLAPGEAAGFRAYLEASRGGPQAEVWQGHALIPGGRRLDIEVQASPVQVGRRRLVPCFVRDLTQRRRVEHRVLHFEQVLRGIRDAAVIYDMAGLVVFANTAASRLWDHPADAWGRLTLWDLYASRIPVTLLDGRLVIEGGDDHAEGEFAVQRADGTDRAAFTSFSVIRDAGGTPAGLAAISRDVTQEKALQQQILQVQKMDSIGTLAGGVAHDFNNLLGGILGYAQLIKTHTEAGTRIHSQSEFIEQAAIRASQLTQQLLSFSRKGKYNLRVTTLNEVVGGALTLLEGSLPKTILLHTDFDPDPCPIEVDANQLEQVILNLCINARDAMPQAGWITLRTRTRRLDEEFCTSRLGLTPGPHAELMVKDTGHGIDAETITHIFEPFYTTKELGKGTGLGLSVVYGIVKNHGGHIDVRSTPGIGTQFLIYVPATSKPLSELDEDAVSAADGGNEHILVVDDEPTIRELVTDVLDTYGYRILRADDGMEAVDIYRRNRSSIALVLLDMQMPTLNGVETYRRLREIDPSVRVILSSGFGIDRDIQQLLSEGVLAFIQKPYKINELARVVRECLDKPLTR